MRSSPTLPPLQALRAFEAVARRLSFRRAGEDLLITQSAVSHHIRALEQDLGVRLFVRKPRGVELTPEGERYHDAVRRAFAIIAEGTTELRGRAAKARLRVSLLPSFTANWLVPRLGGFADAHPEIELELEPTLDLADLGAGAADLAIRYGDGRWDGVDCRMLMQERLSPVASPALLRRGPALTEAADVLGHTLLLTVRPYDWTIWAEANGLDLAGARSIQLSDYNITLQAAVDGQGVAMGRLLMLGDRLRSGALVRPCASVVSSPRAAHWLVTARGNRLSAAGEAFADWLAAEAAATEAQVGDPAGAI